MTTPVEDPEDAHRFHYSFGRLVPVGPRPTSFKPLSLDERFPPLSPERQLELLRAAAVQIPKQRSRRASPGTPHTYLIGADGSPLVKIGYASDPRKRLKSLQTGQPMTLSLLWTQPGNYESALHQRFAEHQVRGEWFDLTALGDAVEVVEAAIEEIERQQATAG